MAPVEEYKARRRVKVIAHVLFGINVAKCFAAGFLLIYFGAVGRGTMNTSKGGARCVTANSENISQIPEMDVLTVKEREYLAFESTAFSFISLLLTAPQVFSAVLLIKATDNGVKGAEVFGLIDHHAQIQLRYTIFQVLLVGASYYFSGFCTIFYLATGDGAFNSVLLLILSMFLCEFYLEECRNNEGDLEAQRNQRKSSEKEKKVDENKKDMQEQDDTKAKPVEDISSWV